MSGGSYSVHSSIYLDTPIMIPTPEPLEYVPLSCQAALGSLEGVPRLVQELTSVIPEGVLLTHPHCTTHTQRMHPPIGPAQPRRVMQPATGQEKRLEIRPQGGNPWKKFSRRVWRGLTPHTRPRAGGGGREATGVLAETAMGPERFFNSTNRGGTPGKKLAAGIGKA